MDPLSDVLSLLRPRSLMSAGLDAGDPWSIAFPGQAETIKCGAVVSGECRLAMDGVAGAVALAAGDFFLLPHGRPFRLGGGAAVPPADAAAVFAPARDGGILVHNGGSRPGAGAFLVSSRFSLAGDHAAVLLGMLPPIVHLRGTAEPAGLRGSVERMMRELREPRPGGALVLQHLAHMMLVQALRDHLAAAAPGGVGWLFALADRRVAAAIAAMHADPAGRWTVEALARRAGMSRSSFAQAFRAKVGVTPMEYLTRWRMMLAADRLARGGEPVSVVAPALGYDSDSAFSAAFKRVMGRSPRQHGRGPAARAAGV